MDTVVALSVCDPDSVLRWGMSHNELLSVLRETPSAMAIAEDGRIRFPATVFSDMHGEIQAYFGDGDTLNQVIVKLTTDAPAGFRAALDALFTKVQTALERQFGAPMTSRGEYPQWPTFTWLDDSVEVKHHVYDHLGTEHVVSLRLVRAN